MSNCKPNVRAWTPIWYKVDCSELNFTSSDNSVTITKINDCCGWDFKAVGGGGGGTGSVTSVGLSMPSAFHITGSPITSTGTLAVTMTGTTNQYLRGNGTLATFPTIPEIPGFSNGVMLVGDVVELGGTLVQFTDIDNNGNGFFLHGTGETTFRTDNGTFQSLVATSATSSSLSTANTATNFFSEVNAIDGRASIIAGNSTTFYNGMYADLSFVRMEVKTNTVSPLKFEMTTNGKLQATAYGAGTITGTPTRYLGVDASGYIIETTVNIPTVYWASNSTNNINNTNSLGVGIGVNSPLAALHIKAGTTTLAPLKFSSGGLLAAPVDGAVEYDGVNLYFTTGVTRKIFPLGTTDTTIYSGDGNIGGPRAINVQGNSVTWNNTGLFRIVEGDSTVGGTYDFNSGVDLLAFNAANSSNLVLNASSGLTFEYTDVVTPAVLTSLKVDIKGVKFTGIQEFTDNAAAITGGLTAGYIYRTGDALKIVH